MNERFPENVLTPGVLDIDLKNKLVSITYGEPGGTRTHGPKIKSLVLYQLSYRLAGAL